MRLLCCSVIPLGKCQFQSFTRSHRNYSRNKDRIARVYGPLCGKRIFFLHPSGGKSRKVPTCLWRLAMALPTHKTICKSPKSFGKRCLKSLSLWARNKSDALFKVTACSGCATPRSIIWPVKCCAVLKMISHQDVLQRGLDLAHDWMTQHPEQSRELTRTLFKELGSGNWPKEPVDWHRCAAKPLTHSFNGSRPMLADPEHPWRQKIGDRTRAYARTGRHRK